MHVCKSKGDKVDMVNTGIRCRCRKINEGKFDFIQACNIKLKDHLDYDDYYSYHEFAPGWARRPQHGQGHGKNHISDSIQDVEECCLEGSKDKKGKIVPGRMRDLLTEKYLDRFDIPSEAELCQQISKFLARERKILPPVPEDNGNCVIGEGLK